MSEDKINGDITSEESMDAVIASETSMEATMDIGGIGGGSDVTKAYVDQQDQAIRDDLNVLDGSVVKTVNGVAPVDGNVDVQGGGGSTVTIADNPDGGVDLTVDGSTKTLAKEGELATIKADLTKLNNIVLAERIAETFTKNVNTTQGSPIYAGTNQLPVTISNGDTYTFELVDNIGAVPNFFLYMVKTDNTRVVVVDARILPNTKYIFVANADIKFLNLYIDSCGATGTIEMVANIVEINEDSLQSKVDTLGNRITTVEDNVSELADKHTSTNIFNNEVWDVAGYIAGSTFITASGYYTTKPIFLKSGSYLYNIKKSTYGGGYTVFAKTDENGNIQTAQASVDTNVLFDDTNIMKITVEEGYYRFNIGSGSASIGKFMLVNGSSASDFPTQYVPYSADYYVLANNVSNNEYNPLYGKKIAVTGDSICYGQGFAGGYAKIIADRNKMAYQNIGVAGGTICYGTTYQSGQPRFCICRSIENLDENADYVILEGGVNDNVTDKIGTITDGYTATFDDTYFYGAVESMFKQLIEKFKGKKYGFVIVHQMTTTMKPNGTRYNAIKECGAKWGVPILDLSTEIPPLGLFPSTNILRTTYTSSGDGWHPNEEGYKKYYCDKIESWMKTL